MRTAAIGIRCLRVFARVCNRPEGIWSTNQEEITDNWSFAGILSDAITRRGSFKKEKKTDGNPLPFHLSFLSSSPRESFNMRRLLNLKFARDSFHKLSRTVYSYTRSIVMIQRCNVRRIFYYLFTLYHARTFETAECWFLLTIVRSNLLLRIVVDAAENEGQDLRENIDVRIQASTETLDHQHAENHAAEGSVLLDSMTDHRGE